MADSFIMTVREVKNGAWGPDPDRIRWLRVPDRRNPDPSQEDHDVDGVIDNIMAAAGGDEARAANNQPAGDLLVFVHGFNNSPTEVIARHRKLKSNLRKFGYRGEVLSFDWPCDQTALAYLDDLSRARETARLLVTDCISKFAARARAAGMTDGGCNLNVHLLAHSMGTFVVREAFAQTSDTISVNNSPWLVNQAVFISGDISSDSMSVADRDARSIAQRTMRLTNYSNPYDAVLSISNAKRLGTKPRVGRVGLPPDHDSRFVEVRCGEYYAKKYGSLDMADSHSFWFDDSTFYRDFAFTLAGEIDRNYIPTRTVSDDGLLELHAFTGKS